jgi:hypothetical protein
MLIVGFGDYFINIDINNDVNIYFMSIKVNDVKISNDNKMHKDLHASLDFIENVMENSQANYTIDIYNIDGLKINREHNKYGIGSYEIVIKRDGEVIIDYLKEEDLQSFSLHYKGQNIEFNMNKHKISYLLFEGYELSKNISFAGYNVYSQRNFESKSGKKKFTFYNFENGIKIDYTIMIDGYLSQHIPPFTCCTLIRNSNVIFFINEIDPEKKTNGSITFPEMEPLSQSQRMLLYDVLYIITKTITH